MKGFVNVPGASMADLEKVQKIADQAAINRSYTLTHSKSGTVHTLTGMPTEKGIFTAQFVAVDAFAEGDGFSDGENVYTAKPNGEETALPGSAFVAGDLVSVVIDTTNKKLGFKLGGGSADVTSTLPPPVESITAEGGDGEVTVSFPLLAEEYNDLLGDDPAYILVLKQGSVPESPSDGTVVKFDKTGAVI